MFAMRAVAVALAMAAAGQAGFFSGGEGEKSKQTTIRTWLFNGKPTKGKSIGKSTGAPFEVTRGDVPPCCGASALWADDAKRGDVAHRMTKSARKQFREYLLRNPGSILAVCLVTITRSKYMPPEKWYIAKLVPRKTKWWKKLGWKKRGTRNKLVVSPCCGDRVYGEPGSKENRLPTRTHDKFDIEGPPDKDIEGLERRHRRYELSLRVGGVPTSTVIRIDSSLRPLRPIAHRVIE